MAEQFSLGALPARPVEPEAPRVVSTRSAEETRTRWLSILDSHIRLVARLNPEFTGYQFRAVPRPPLVGLWTEAIEIAVAQGVCSKTDRFVDGHRVWISHLYGEDGK